MKDRGHQGSVVALTRLRERGNKSQNPVTMHSVLQGDNYFLLPSSVTLPVGPSLETLHGTHRCRTKHERRGSESVRLKEYDVSRITHTKKAKCIKNKVWQVFGRWGGPQGTWNLFLVSHCVCEGTWHLWWRVLAMAGYGHLGMAGTRVPFSSMKWPPALSTQRWWREMRACLAVVGVSFPSWLSAFFSGENSSSRSTSYTANVLLERHQHRGKGHQTWLLEWQTITYNIIQGIYSPVVPVEEVFHSVFVFSLCSVSCLILEFLLLVLSSLTSCLCPFPRPCDCLLQFPLSLLVRRHLCLSFLCVIPISCEFLVFYPVWSMFFS